MKRKEKRSTFHEYVSSPADYMAPPDASNARLIGGSDDEDDDAVERGLTVCRKVLIALLVFLGLLYYVTYEYDEVYYESQNGAAAKENLFAWFSHDQDAQQSRPAMVAPDPFKLPTPDPSEEAEHHLPLAYVIGAPKCGCEILRQYLKYHPQVFFADRTQISYWDKFASNGLEWYKQQLPKTKSWQIGTDYTTDYFIAPGVPSSIDAALGNHTRIILMVCDPIERAQVDYHEIMSGIDTRHNEWRQKLNAVGESASTFDKFAALYVKYLRAIMANPAQAEGINTYEEFVENIATIRPEASILTTSLYDIHIRRWLAHFDRGNMLVMDGRSLQTQPIVAIRRAQNFLRISDSIPSKAFNFNNTIGLFCMHMKYVTNEERIECPSRHDFLMPMDTPVVKEETRSLLKSFFQPHMAAFAHMSNETFHWAFDNMQTQLRPS